jgi:hypothetical protein
MRAGGAGRSRSAWTEAPHLSLEAPKTQQTPVGAVARAVMSFRSSSAAKAHSSSQRAGLGAPNEARRHGRLVHM